MHVFYASMGLKGTILFPDHFDELLESEKLDIDCAEHSNLIFRNILTTCYTGIFINNKHTYNNCII